MRTNDISQLDILCKDSSGRTPSPDQLTSIEIALDALAEKHFCYISGPAGSGKTFISTLIARAFDAVQFVSPTGKAAAVQRSYGVNVIFLEGPR